MKTITYSELIKLIEQGKPPRKIRVISAVSEDYEWYDYAGDYYDYKDRPIKSTYSLKSLVKMATIEIMTTTNAEKFEEVFGKRIVRSHPIRICPPFVTNEQCHDATSCKVCAGWWDEPYEGDK